jgi:hypothetical protein
MARIAAAQDRAVAGDQEGARADFATIWAGIGEEGDALHIVSLAHYLADLEVRIVLLSTSVGAGGVDP